MLLENKNDFNCTIYTLSLFMATCFCHVTLVVGFITTYGISAYHWHDIAEILLKVELIISTEKPTIQKQPIILPLIIVKFTCKDMDGNEHLIRKLLILVHLLILNLVNFLPWWRFVSNPYLFTLILSPSPAH